MLGGFATDFSADIQITDDMVAAGVFGMLLAMAGVICAVGMVLFVLRVIAYWRLFVKAGEPGWVSIIPFYHRFVLYKLTWNTTMFWVELVLSVVTCVLSSMVNEESNVLLIIGTLAAAIALAVVGIKSDIKLAKSFGKGTAFALGLIFFNQIFELILGFGKSQYIGPDGEAA